METFIDRDELARILSVPPSTVDYLRRKRGLPSFKIGKHFRYQITEVQRWSRNNVGIKNERSI